MFMSPTVPESRSSIQAEITRFAALSSAFLQEMSGVTTPWSTGQAFPIQEAARAPALFQAEAHPAAAAALQVEARQAAAIPAAAILAAVLLAEVVLEAALPKSKTQKLFLPA